MIVLSDMHTAPLGTFVEKPYKPKYEGDTTDQTQNSSSSQLRYLMYKWRKPKRMWGTCRIHASISLCSTPFDIGGSFKSSAGVMSAMALPAIRRFGLGTRVSEPPKMQQQGSLPGSPSAASGTPLHTESSTGSVTSDSTAERSRAAASCDEPTELRFTARIRSPGAGTAGICNARSMAGVALATEAITADGACDASSDQ